MIHAITYARENKIPFFGICLGMQCATIEYARQVSKLERADSTEFDASTPNRVIYKLRELLGVDEMGGTMRLGAWPCKLEPGSFAAKAYGATEISERHRHRYEFNCEYEETLTEPASALPGARPMASTWRLSRFRIIRGSSAASSIRNSNPNRWRRTRFSRLSFARAWGTGRSASGIPWKRAPLRCTLRVAPTLPIPHLDLMPRLLLPNFSGRNLCKEKSFGPFVAATAP